MPIDDDYDCLAYSVIEYDKAIAIAVASDVDEWRDECGRDLNWYYDRMIDAAYTCQRKRKSPKVGKRPVCRECGVMVPDVKAGAFDTEFEMFLPPKQLIKWREMKKKQEKECEKDE